MKYPQFDKQTKSFLTFRLLELHGIISRKTCFIEIDNSPDYDISEYGREIERDYYFRNSWEFGEDFDIVFQAEFHKSAIFHSDNISDMIKDYKLDYLNGEDFTKVVSEVYKLHGEDLYIYSFETDLDEYTLNTLRLHSIDNFEKIIWYDGSFMGNNYSIDPIDFQLIARTEFIGISTSKTLPFYLQLLGESFLLQKENRFKLSYFLTYSALENFVNTIMNSHEDEGRFLDKFKDLFKSHLPDYSKNQIYTTLCGSLNNFTNQRNIIVHGKEVIEVNFELSDSFLRHVLIFISLYEWKTSTFQEFYDKLIE